MPNNARGPATDAPTLSIESSDFACEDAAVVALDGVEAISHLYRFEATVLFRESTFPGAGAIAGASVTLAWAKEGVVVRRVHGMVRSVVDPLLAVGEGEDRRMALRLTIVPRAFRLSLVELFDIYVHVSIPDLVRQKLDNVGLAAAADFRLTGTYEVREFVAQYKESDLAFVSRMLEHLGISYFFEQGESEERIVLTDHAAGFSRVADSIAFHVRGETSGVFELEARREVVPSVYTVRDWNYRTPLVDLTGTVEIAEGYAGGIIEYGGHCKTPEGAQKLARVRADERLARELVYSGASARPELFAGGQLKIEGHPALPDDELLVTEVRHEARYPYFGHHEVEPVYRNRFSAIPAARTYRPDRVTPRPRIHGVVNGVIDDPAGGSAGSAKIDDQGRYTVRLMFDSTPAGERRASHPIRMAQQHAGPNYGTHFPLTPGVEVVVAFVEGDPDRPIIVGAVPNPTTPSPVLAAEANVNRIKTKSGISIEFRDRR